MRPTGGILRTREFVMKDLYSFHTDKEDLDQYYNQAIKAYKKIFTRCGLVVKVIQAQGGAIGGNVTHEFNMLCSTGEDKVLYCQKCDFAANEEAFKGNKCPKCEAKLVSGKGIENGHIFKLETKYSKDMNLYYSDKKGAKQLVWMGCYGIGLQRLMATIVEAYHDEKGIIWPKTVAPFDCYLISIQKDVKSIYEKLSENFSVLWDDRKDMSVGQKFSDADLLGIPVRLVISAKTGDKIEWKERNKKDTELLTLNEVIAKLKS
jgi:prolyl-tRNA synthetase